MKTLSLAFAATIALALPATAHAEQSPFEWCRTTSPSSMNPDQLRLCLMLANFERNFFREFDSGARESDTRPR